MKIHSFGSLIPGSDTKAVMLTATDAEFSAFCTLLGREYRHFALSPKFDADPSEDPGAPKRENYRETPVKGTDLIVKAWNLGKHVHAVISWPPHGIPRPLGLTLTFSQAEVDLLATAYNDGQHTKESEDLIVNISTAVLVQCGLLRKLQSAGAAIDLVAPPEVKP